MPGFPPLMFFPLWKPPQVWGGVGSDWAALGLWVFSGGRQDWEDGTSVQPHVK